MGQLSFMDATYYIRERGYSVGYNGGKASNPYPENSDNADAWDMGYDEGKQAKDAEAYDFNQ